MRDEIILKEYWSWPVRKIDPLSNSIELESKSIDPVLSRGNNAACYVGLYKQDRTRLLSDNHYPVQPVGLKLFSIERLWKRFTSVHWRWLNLQTTRINETDNSNFVEPYSSLHHATQTAVGLHIMKYRILKYCIVLICGSRYL